MRLIDIVPPWKPEDVTLACLQQAVKVLHPGSICLVSDNAGEVCKRLVAGLRHTKDLPLSIVEANIDDEAVGIDNNHHSRRVALMRETAREDALKSKAQSVF